MPSESNPADVYKHACESRRCHVSRTLLKQFPSRFEDMDVLDLSSTMVGRNGAHAISEICARASKLRTLRLVDNYLTNDAVAFLSATLVHHPSLQEIDLSKNPISHAAGKTLFKLVSTNRKIQEIHLSGTLINPALVNIIRRTCHANSSVAPPPPPPVAADADPGSHEGKDTTPRRPLVALPLLGEVLPQQGYFAVRILLASSNITSQSSLGLSVLHRAVVDQQLAQTANQLSGLVTLVASSTAAVVQPSVVLGAVIESSDSDLYALHLLHEVAGGEAFTQRGQPKNTNLMQLVEALRAEHADFSGIECLAAALLEEPTNPEAYHHHLHVVIDQAHGQHSALTLLTEL